MAGKGIKGLFFPSRSHPSLVTSRDNSSPASSTIDRTIETAGSIITKWDPEASAYSRVTSLFYEDKREAAEFIKCVADLQATMHHLASLGDPSSNGRLVTSQSLMQLAMKRLQKEFYQLLSMNRAHLDPESVSASSTRSSTSDFDVEEDDGAAAAGDSITEVEEVSSAVMSDLKSIADCMIASGYTKECVSVYKSIRKSIVDEAVYKLGVERLTVSKVHKMEWEPLGIRIKNWLEAVKVSMSSLFAGERILCDVVFSGSDAVRESCFGDISREAALLLFGFPEMASRNLSKRKLSNDERIFRALDMYSALAANWPEIQSIFSFESTSAVRSQALASLIKLHESVKLMLADFESSIQADSSKEVPPGGGLHPLATRAMNYLTLIGDYSNILGDILVDSPDPDESTSNPCRSEISHRLERHLLVLLCKLDAKAKHYKDVFLSYLFLVNNLRHVVSRVRASNLQDLLGEEWIATHEAKIKQFAANYERLAWGPVISSLEINTPMDSPEEMEEVIKRFNVSFEEAYRKQKVCILVDPKLRDEFKVSIARRIAPVYDDLYDKYRQAVIVRSGGKEPRDLFAPVDVRNFLSDLYFGDADLGGSSHSSSSSTSSRTNRRRPRLGF